MSEIPYSQKSSSTEAENSSTEVKPIHYNTIPKFDVELKGDASFMQQDRASLNDLVGNTDCTNSLPQKPRNSAAKLVDRKSQKNSGKSLCANQRKSEIRHFLTGHLPMQSETTFFILVSVLDIFLTYYVLKFGGVEANPIARFFFAPWNIQGMIAFKMVMVTIIVVLAQIVAIRNPIRARLILISGILVVSCVLAYSAFLVYSLN